MADNADRLKAFEELVGKEKAAQVLATAEEMSLKADKFLASKEKKDEPETEEPETEGKKKKVKVEDDAEAKEMKELLVSMKEASEKATAELQLAIKEQSDKTDKAIAELVEKNTQLEGDVAQAQKAFSLLMGIQPKATQRGFKASESGDEPTLTKEQEKVAKQQEKSVKQGDDWIGGIADFVIHGKSDAVGA